MWSTKALLRRSLALRNVHRKDIFEPNKHQLASWLYISARMSVRSLSTNSRGESGRSGRPPRQGDGRGNNRNDNNGSSRGTTNRNTGGMQRRRPHPPPPPPGGYPHDTPSSLTRRIRDVGPPPSTTSSPPPNHGRRPRKESFDDKILRPAFQGELGKKHSTGIPRLAARKHKARLTPPPKHLTPANDTLASDLNDDDDASSSWDDIDEEMLSATSGLSSSLSQPPNHSSSHPSSSAAKKLGYYSMTLMDDSKYFWREEEYESLAVKDLPTDFYNEDGQFEVEYSKEDMTSTLGYLEEGDEDYEDVDDTEDNDLVAESSFRHFRSSGRGEAWEYQDPEEHFFLNQNDVFHLASLDDNEFKNVQPEPNLVMPLRPHGPELDDFLEAVMEHPTKYAQIESIHPHIESTREPKPYFPKDRLHPTEQFLNAHARFLFVTGLPPLEVDGEAGDLENAIHRSFLQKTVANLVNVDSSSVFPASTTSAFVGFPSPAALAQTLSVGPSETVIVNPPLASLWKGEIPSSWSGSNDGAAIVQLSNIPPGNTGMTLRRALIPEGSEIESVYGNVTEQDFFFQSSSSVLVRFASAEQAESAVQSQLFQDQLRTLGQYVPRFQRARRELVHAGFTGPDKSDEKRTMGPRLIVDGDMPSKNFFLSHARLVHARNLDPTLTPEQLSQAFDRYCSRRRDVVGSTEIVTCHAGIPTGSAYIGFDSPGEAEVAVRDLNGVLKLGGTRASLRLVKDRIVPGQPLIRPERRGERSVEELLDDLNNWEKYVDPADVKVLEQAGISKVILDEALRNIRYSNKTFGSFDSALRYEALEPEKMSGQLYGELVQLYITTLKDCLPTPDNVGAMYEATHFPDEPIDTSIFESEEARQKRLLEKRARP